MAREREFDMEAEPNTIDVEAEPGTDLVTAPQSELATTSTNPISIIQQMSSDPNCDVEKFSRLMDLQERFENRLARKAFGEALAKFQSQCPIIKKRRTAQGRKMSFNYAGFDDVMVAIRPVLAECGLSVSFSSDTPEAGKIHVTVTIQHGTHSETSEFTCPVPTEMTVNQTQKMGAALSYAKRYALCGALNIVVSDEDWEAPPSERPDQDPNAPKATTRDVRAKAMTFDEQVQDAYSKWWGPATEMWPGEPQDDMWERFGRYVNGVACATVPYEQWDEALIGKVRDALAASDDPRPPEPGGDA